MVEEVGNLERRDLLKSRLVKMSKQDPHSILVCSWHHISRNLPSTLNQNYDILKNDARLSNIFSEKATVAFRKKKNIRNILCRNDAERGGTSH